MKRKVFFGAVLFVLIFAGTALAFNYILNRGYEARRVESASSELPALSVLWNENRINRLYGYKTEADPVPERSAVTPVGKDKTFSVLVPSWAASSEISYELWDEAGGNLIENGTLARQEGGELAEYPVEIRMDMTPGREYLFQVRLQLKGEVVRYYTRVVRWDHDQLSRLLIYAENFSSEALARRLPEEGVPAEWIREAANLADENGEAEEDEEKTASLGNVTLESSVYDVLYGGMNLSLVSERVPELREVSENDAVIRFTTRVMAADGKSYNLQETMTLEYDNSSDQVVLREYLRQMDLEPSGDVMDASSNSLFMGIISEDPAWVASEDLTRMLYTAGGTIWFYDYRNGLIAELFGRSGTETRQDGYRLVPLYVDETRADFMVLGRIPEGRNEGKNGLLLLTYSAEEDVLTDTLLLETAETAELLRQEAEKFVHYDQEEKAVILLLNDSLMKIYLADGTTEALVEGIPSSRFLVSEDRKLLVWPDSADPAQVETLTVWNLETGTKKEEKSAGMRLSPIGFMGDCFIYGMASTNNIVPQADGTAKFYYSSLVITDGEGLALKKYSKSGKLVQDVEFLNNVIYLTLAEKSGGVYGEGGKDYISYKPETVTGVIEVTGSVKNGAEVRRITFPTSVYFRNKPAEIIPTVSVGSKLLKLELEYASQENAVYVYNGKGLTGTLASTGAAIRQVNEEGGYVVKNGQPLYRKREAAAYYTVAGTFTYENAKDDAESYRACLVMALRSAGLAADAAEFDPDADWEEAFRGKSGSVLGLNFSGADVDTGVLFLGEGCPFAVRLENRYVLVVSYNDDYIRYYDPVEQEEKRVLRSRFSRDAEDSGSEFYTWRKGGV